MTIRVMGSLLCGGLLALAATTGAVAEGKGKKQTKVDGPQAVEFVFIQFAGKKNGDTTSGRGGKGAVQRDHPRGGGQTGLVQRGRR
jgi:hypothetical protein